MISDVEVIDVKGVKVMVRKGTSDYFVADEVIHGNTYRKLNVLSSDTVLDLGLNIGMFTVSALKKGAKKVVSYEPDKDNFEMAKANVILNIGDNSRYQLINKAVTGTDEEVRWFFLNNKKNKGAHSLVSKLGRSVVKVECENINSVIEKVNPTVVKMDIEGGEYECLKVWKDFSGIREMELEFHHAHLNDIKTREKYREVVGILKNNFSRVDYREETKKAWVTLIYCSQE